MTKEIPSFTDWINSQSSVDLHLKGAAFTWSNHQSPPILSRLNRFLVSREWLDLYPEVCQIAPPKPASDHCPILLDSNCERCGPAPFCFELMWLEEKKFSQMVTDWWKEIQVQGWAGHRLMVKLKLLKSKLKVWAREKFGDVGVQKVTILEKTQPSTKKKRWDNCPMKIL